jgi:hypothetical protein|tara:strand:- start:751 stop:879 length:129 start_codon:yes stop_codon:yes gene_type:complete
MIRKILSYWRIRNLALTLAYEKTGFISKLGTKLFLYIDRVGE